jgi:hypothetical protein
VDLLIRQRLHHTNHYYQNVPVRISYFDSDWHRFDETVNVSGECTSHSSLLQFEPVYIAIDFDQKLQDAITDEWYIIRNTGSYNFGVAKTTVNVAALTDSALLRVEYNWVQPEPMKNKIPGLHLHDKHYWTVDGLHTEKLSSSARFVYNGNDASLDAAFLTNREDSILIMYRANADSEWVKADSFILTPGGSLTDKVGYATVYNLKKGQYTFAIYNAAVADTSTVESDCLFNSVSESATDENQFQVFPNPAQNRVTITFDRNRFTGVAVYDILGREITEESISPSQNRMELTLPMNQGSYLITLTSLSGQRYSRIIMKQ